MIACTSDASNSASAGLKCAARPASWVNKLCSGGLNDGGGCSGARAVSIGTTERLAALRRGMIHDLTVRKSQALLTFD
jgi:hypothetical protein